jgi:hypothetical protein
MPLVRFAAVVVAVLALAAPASAGTRLAQPKHLHAFLLRANEPEAHLFSRTPSFAWTPVRGAKHYEFVLSTSPLFASSDPVWDDQSLQTPAAAIPLTLPWITGSPYSLYARVRALAADGSVGPWSEPFGFNMRWAATPAQLPAGAGYVRWTPVDGATSYQVWYTNVDVGGGVSKIVSTVTNVADEREYYSFHQDSAWTGTVKWRVRAVRRVADTTGPANGLPVVSYGPWSTVFTSTNPSFARGPLSLASAVSDATSTPTQPAAHALMPVFTYSGDQDLHATPHELYRVYVFTDSDCLNRVFQGSIVGSPAYAPRISGVLNVPKTMKALSQARLKDLGDTNGDPMQLTADGQLLSSTEVSSASSFTATLIQQQAAAAGSSSDGSFGPGSSGSRPSGGSTFPPVNATFPGTLVGEGAPVDLSDTQWPSARYYWTVVPVQWSVGVDPNADPNAPLPTDPALVYSDTDVAQDACAHGRVASFGKRSQPALTASGAPYASGLSTKGALLPAAVKTPTFAGPPLVAWQPALAATAYEVQWSKSNYPWRPTGNLFTFSTSANLPLTPGRWFYRVRGIDLSLPTGATQLAWSDTVGVVIAKPTFKVGGK